ncbi:MAG: peptide chain release factor 3, partial [Cytophagaceae bacterium]
GKTTLTEKLLLYGGAIQLAGSVHARKSQRKSTSDWMELEKQRGISVTSTVLQFEYEGHVLNLLDTPGHNDFSADTYRTLTAADSAVMLIDNAKGVEGQTKKLFAVCRQRGIPIFTFVNKMDHPGRGPLALLTEVENVLGIQSVPVNWPIGQGDDFRGIYDRESKKVHLYSRTAHGATKAELQMLSVDDPSLESIIGTELYAQLLEDIELIEIAGEELDLDRVAKGELTPVFFGSAITNFGVEPFLQRFLDLAPSPQPRRSEGEWVNTDAGFSGFVFKIQANMDPAHRDRIAFMRVVSGRFEKDMEVTLRRDDEHAIGLYIQPISDEFDHLLSLLDFETNAYEIFRKWYVDGRLYYHIIIDEKNQKNGIQELRYIDPRKIRLMREVQEVKKEGGYSVQKTVKEFYVYNDRGFAAKDIIGNPISPTAAGLQITKDSICYVTSGITDQNNNIVLSHLNKAIKPLNSLRVLEDATVIYRISRAPERRIFYIDVGNLPKQKAEQHVRETMSRHKNRVVYDQSTGEIRDDRKYMTMQEDYWFPRRDNGKATSVETLPAGQNLGELTDVEYFQKQLYMALNIPVSRLQPDLGMTLGRSSEISRDEVKFSHFVHRMRKRFTQLFLKLLEKQLVMRRVISPEEWPIIARKIEFDFVEDNHFAELKNLERSVEQKGLTIIPLRLFTNEKGMAKLDIGLCRGKKTYDKRETLKDQDTKRDLDRIKKEYR